jgi:cytochrome c5
MKKAVLYIVLAVLCCITTVVLLLSVPHAYADKKSEAAGKAVFEQKCLKCHKIAKFKEQENSRKDWVVILSRMQRGTCPMTDEELELLADYLAKAYGN